MSMEGPAVKRKPINSSVIASVGHDLDVLEIEFKGGRVAHYLGVPPDVYEALVRAPSPGAYFNREVRGQYEYREVADRGDITTGGAREEIVGPVQGSVHCEL